MKHPLVSLYGKFVLLGALALPLCAQAQLDFLKKGAEKALGGAGSDASGAAQAPASTAAPQSYSNTDRKFRFTLPGGWQQMSGDPDSENVLFMKPGTTQSFQFHITQMGPSFPAESSVSASLKQSEEQKQIGKLAAVKRRDDGGKQSKCGVIGWEIVESATGGGGEHQRIIWQAYDGENYYFNFMAASHPNEFTVNQAALQGIIDSINFCG